VGGVDGRRVARRVGHVDLDGIDTAEHLLGRHLLRHAVLRTDHPVTALGRDTGAGERDDAPTASVAPHRGCSPAHVPCLAPPTLHPALRNSPFPGSWKLVSARHRGHDTRQLARPVGERRRSGLQNAGAFHLVELVLHHRPDPRPARSPHDPRSDRLFAALARDGDLGIPARHFLRCEDAPARAPLGARLRADVVAPASSISSPADAGDEGIGPLLEEGARAPRQARRSLGHAREGRHELADQGLARLRPIDQGYRPQPCHS
jgi:hypothetical protein